MVSFVIPTFVILLIARTARIACADRQTDRQTHETTTVTLDAHARRGLTSRRYVSSLFGAEIT